MLETIKAEIAFQKYKPSFSDFYIDYMFKVQDENLSNEILYLFKRNKIDASNLCNLIEDEYKKMVSI